MATTSDSIDIALPLETTRGAASDVSRLQRRSILRSCYRGRVPAYALADGPAVSSGTINGS